MGPRDAGAEWPDADVFAEDTPLLGDEDQVDVGPGLRGDRREERPPTDAEKQEEPRWRTRVHEATWSVKVRHSRAYLVMNVVQAAVVVAMIAWLSADNSAVHHPGFVVLETFVTLSVCFDTVLMIHFEGVRAYFCCGAVEEPGLLATREPYGRKDLETSDEVAETPSPLAQHALQNDAKAVRVLHSVFNYGQVTLAILSMVGLVSTLRLGRDDWEENLALTLLLVRCSVYLIFFVLNHLRNALLQGKLLRCCKLGSDEVDADWDVKF